MYSENKSLTNVTLKHTCTHTQIQKKRKRMYLNQNSFKTKNVNWYISWSGKTELFWYILY